MKDFKRYLLNNGYELNSYGEYCNMQEGFRIKFSQLNDYPNIYSKFGFYTKNYEKLSVKLAEFGILDLGWNG